ncbi:hypothetical protein DFO66_10651 [Brevibacterium sanguinis]|uniref:Uncharacterized protein n=2 Tax=Brevibacterium TaxID=1696 RepID=A0A366IL53_9MICO|nr:MULTISPECIES: hypothetical protein [Brevibacterium]RBP64653.1 hypothetical protein DFO66_10651 [Brevibacterium sanguinis]RBP71704.1 hypothetical protein DFO65_105310 [Brevibacterium celere]
MDFTLDAFLLTLALNHRLRATMAPDEVSSAFLDDGRDVPLIVADDVFSSAPPTGLLLFAAEIARHGVTHARLALHHPSLPHTTPPVAKEHRLRVGRHSAPVILHRGERQIAVVLLGAEENVEVIGCADAVYRPVTVGTPAEALRRLRLLVMEGLGIVETVEVPEAWRSGPWRDWQEELSTSHPLSKLIPRSADGRAIHAALDIHDRMRTVLAPATVAPPEFGALLSRLHPAAADYITAVATMRE